MTDALSLDTSEYEVTNRYNYTTVASTVVTYKNFDVPENREVRWDDNGLYGPDMYCVVPLPETFADVVAHNSRMLGGHLPAPQETIVPTESVEQVQEKTYHHKGPHHNEPALRRRKYLRYRSQSVKNPLHTGKPNHRSHSPGELDRGYHREYVYGVDANDYYYRPEMIDYYDYDYDLNDASIHGKPTYYQEYENGGYDYNKGGGCGCPMCCDDYSANDDHDPYNAYEFEYEDCRNCGELFTTIRWGGVCIYCGY